MLGTRPTFPHGSRRWKPAVELRPNGPRPSSGWDQAGDHDDGTRPVTGGAAERGRSNLTSRALLAFVAVALTAATGCVSGEVSSVGGEADGCDGPEALGASARPLSELDVVAPAVPDGVTDARGLVLAPMRGNRPAGESSFLAPDPDVPRLVVVARSRDSLDDLRDRTLRLFEDRGWTAGNTSTSERNGRETLYGRSFTGPWASGSVVLRACPGGDTSVQLTQLQIPVPPPSASRPLPPCAVLLDRFPTGIFDQPRQVIAGGDEQEREDGSLRFCRFRDQNGASFDDTVVFAIQRPTVDPLRWRDRLGILRDSPIGAAARDGCGPSTDPRPAPPGSPGGAVVCSNARTGRATAAGVRENDFWAAVTMELGTGNRAKAGAAEAIVLDLLKRALDLE